MNTRVQMGAAWMMLLFWLIISSSATPQKLGNVFQVDLRDPTNLEHLSSCARIFQSQGNAFSGKPYFDPDASFQVRDTAILNNIWYQAYSMMRQSRTSLHPDGYSRQYEIIKLIYSFWDVLLLPGRLGRNQLPADEQKRIKLNAIRSRYRRLFDFMNTEIPDGPQKPKMFCDSTYLHLQNKDDPARDETGQEIVDSNTGLPWKLQDWEAQHSRNFDDFWYSWFDVGFDKGYMVMRRDTYPALSQNNPYPWEIDDDINQSTFCADETNYGLMLQSAVPDGKSEGTGGTDAWSKGMHIILCPSSFEFGRPDDFTEQQPFDTRLDDMEITAQTLFHELFHLIYPGAGDAPDYEPYLPVRVPDTPEGVISQDFPHYKSGFTLSRSQTMATSAMECMTLAMFERAEPATPLVQNMKSWRTPECYTQFSRALFLTVHGSQDWSSGVCRPMGANLVGPTASIPEKWALQTSVATWINAPSLGADEVVDLNEHLNETELSSFEY